MVSLLGVKATSINEHETLACRLDFHFIRLSYFEKTASVRFFQNRSAHTDSARIVNAYENAGSPIQCRSSTHAAIQKRVAPLLNQQQDHPQRAGGIRTLAQPPISITP